MFNKIQNRMQSPFSAWLFAPGLRLIILLVLLPFYLKASSFVELPAFAQKVIYWFEQGGEERVAKEIEKLSPTLQAGIWYFLALDPYHKLSPNNGLKTLKQCIKTSEASPTVIRACQVLELYKVCFLSLWLEPLNSLNNVPLPATCFNLWKEYKPSLSWISQRFAFPSRGYELSLAMIGKSIWEKNDRESIDLFKTFGDKWPLEWREKLISLLLPRLSRKLSIQKLLDIYYFKLLTQARFLEAHGELLRGYKVDVQALQLRIKKWIAHNQSDWAWQELELFEKIFSLGKAESHYLRASWYFYNYQFEECDRQITQALSFAGNSFEDLKREILQLKILSLSRQGRLIEAARVMESLRSMIPKTQQAGILFDQGFYHFQAKNWKESVKIFQKVLKYGSLNRRIRQEVKWYLGFAFYLQENFNQAVEIWSELAQDQSYWDRAKVHYWLAQANIKRLQFWSGKKTLESLTLPTSQFLRASVNEQYYSILSSQSLVALQEVTHPLSLLAQRGILLNVESYLHEGLVSDQNRILVELSQTTNVFNNWLSHSLEIKNQTSSACDFNLMQTLLDLKLSFLVKDEVSRCRSLDVVSMFSRLHLYEELINWAKQNNYWYLDTMFPAVYPKEVDKASQHWGVDSSLIRSIIRAESFYKPEAESPAYAKGLMQLMASTAQQISKLAGVSEYERAEQLFEPAINIFLGTAYLRRLLSQFHEQLPLAIAAYNAGPHRVQTWLYRFGEYDYPLFVELIPFNETRNYVKKVLSYFFVYAGRWPSYMRIEVPESLKIPALKESWEQL